jgi:hypothetical protein
MHLQNQKKRPFPIHPIPPIYFTFIARNLGSTIEVFLGLV